MSDLDLVFDFDGWTLNGVYIFSEPAAFAFLGTEDTPSVEVIVRPGLLERMNARLNNQKIQAKRKLYDDYALIYSKLGLWFDYIENCVYNFEICLNDKNNFQSCFPGRFVFGGDTVDFNNHLSIQDVKEIVGEPDEENAEYGYIVYKKNSFELSFLFDDDQRLVGIEGAIVDAEDTA